MHGAALGERIFCEHIHLAEHLNNILQRYCKPAESSDSLRSKQIIGTPKRASSAVQMVNSIRNFCLNKFLKWKKKTPSDDTSNQTQTQNFHRFKWQLLPTLPTLPTLPPLVLLLLMQSCVQISGISFVCLTSKVIRSVRIHSFERLCIHGIQFAGYFALCMSSRSIFLLHILFDCIFVWVLFELNNWNLTSSSSCVVMHVVKVNIT